MEFDQIIYGVPLVFVVISLVGLIKTFGLQGRTLTAISFAIGLLLGIAYQARCTTPFGVSLRQVDQDCCNGIFFPNR